MTDLSPYQITSAKSAPVLPPKPQATLKPYGAWDEEALAAAWAKSARAERHQAATPTSIENNGHRLPDVPETSTLAIMRRLIGKKPISAYMLSRAAGLTQLKCQKAAQCIVKQGEAKIVEHRRGGKTITFYCAFNAPERRENVKDRYTAYPITVRGVTYPSFNACAEALGVTPATVYYHWLRKTADKIGMGRWKDGSAA